MDSDLEPVDGWSNIVVVKDDNSFGIIIEMCYADSENLDKAALGTLPSMDDWEYLSLLLDMGVERILTFGASFRLKKCKVVQGEGIINQMKQTLEGGGLCLIPISI